MLSEEYLRKMEAQILRYQAMEAIIREAREGRGRIIPFPKPPNYDRAA